MRKNGDLAAAVPLVGLMCGRGAKPRTPWRVRFSTRIWLSVPRVGAWAEIAVQERAKRKPPIAPCRAEHVVIPYVGIKPIRMDPGIGAPCGDRPDNGMAPCGAEGDLRRASYRVFVAPFPVTYVARAIGNVCQVENRFRGHWSVPFFLFCGCELTTC